MQMGFFPSPPALLFLFESSYKVGGYWSGTGWLEGASGFAIMAATSQKRGILTLAFGCSAEGMNATTTTGSSGFH